MNIGWASKDVTCHGPVLICGQAHERIAKFVLDPTTINSYFYAISSNFIEDGSYIRLKHVTASYSFAPLLKKVKGIDDVRLSFTATNLFTLTKYTGSDPQINADTSAGGVGGNGIDNYPVPTTRGYNMSLQVAF